MSLKDWFYQKLNPKTLREPQTARAQQLHREFENHPSRGLTPAKLAAILENAVRGDLIAQAELFMDIEEKDTHVGAEMAKRKMAVTGIDWDLRAPRDASAREKQASADLKMLIEDEFNIEDIIVDCLDAIGHGYACLELEWHRTKKGLWLPKTIQHQPQTWFTVPQFDRNTLNLRSNTMDGDPLTPFGWIVHIHKSRSGWLPRVGLHRSLAWPYLFKNYSARDLAELLDIYGLPIRLGKYGANATEKEKADLMRAVVSIGHHAAGIIPESMQMELISMSTSANADPFKTMIEWCEASQSKAILGGTLTSGTAANGARALGEVHNEVRKDIRNSDARQLSQTLSGHLIYPIAVLNDLADPDRCPAWFFDTQEGDDLALFADAMPKLASVGARIPVSWVNRKLKIPEPEGDEPILQMSRPEPAFAAGTIAAAKLPSATIQDPPGKMVELMEKEAAGAVDSMLTSVKAMLSTASDFEDAQRKLALMFSDLDTAALTDVLANGILAANLAGREDLNNGD